MSERQTSPIDAWRLFMETGEIAPSVRQSVAESWRRSKNAGVDPNMATFPNASPQELEGKRASHGELIGRMSKTLESIEQNLSTSGVILALFDETGCLLSSVGDRTLIGYAAGMRLGAGAQLGEDSSGTNAVALVLATGQPSLCWSPEHYCLRLHHLNSAAAPVYGRGGRLLGVLGLLALASGSQAPHLLALAMEAVNSARYQSRTKHLTEWLKQHYHPITDLFGASSEAMAVISSRGYVKQINPAALKLLDISSAKDLDKPIDQVVRFSPALSDRLRSEKPFKDERVEMMTQSDTFALRIDGRPLHDPLGQRLGTMIVFHSREALPKAAAADRPPSAKFTFNDICGTSEAIERARAAAKQVAETSVSVLLEGESGTGKEMFAQAIHNASDRRNGPFVTVNCAAIPPELIESELFGYTPGAFTGARREGMTGKFEAADKGTIFLDEICETALAMQSEILRVLENRTIVRVGEHEEIPVDIRIVAATNRKLLEEVESGNLREDLYYRLSVAKIPLPPLAERVSDIPMLVESFIEQFNQSMGRNVKNVSEHVMSAFMSYHWPGNVRELRNTIEHAVMVAGEETIEWEHLPEELAQSLLYKGAGYVRRDDPLLDQKKGLEKLTHELRDGAKELYMRALKLAEGNRTRAAEILGVGRSTFYRKLAEIEAEGAAGPADFLTEQRRNVEDSTRDLYLEALRIAQGNIRRAAGLVGVGRSTFYRKLAHLKIPQRDLETLRRQRGG
ncbi:MAG: sigma 54-interacting transcriptional regulator [Planctomycetota bacterium]